GKSIRHVATAGASSAAGSGRGGRGGGGGGGRGGRGGGDAAALGTGRGMNQFVWDFRGRDNPDDNMYSMRAGTDPVRMKLGATTVSKTLTVLPDPRAGGSALAEREHGTMSATLAGLIASIDRSLEALRDTRTQARAAGERAKTSPSAERDAAIHALI